MELEGAVAIITGGGRGIGRGIAYELAKAGARIVLADLPDVSDDRDITAADVRQLGGEAIGVDVDVRDWAQVQAMVKNTIDTWGQVDVLVNNAGVIRIGPVALFSEDDWDLIMDVNLKGTFLCSKAVVPHMTQRGRGAIINVSSIAGKRGRGFSSAYSASKFGVIGFTQSLAHEVAAAGVTVNAICPGEVDTAMWRDVLSPAMALATGSTPDQAFHQFIKTNVPIGRPQTAEDMGQAVVFLCRAPNITGIALNVNGGTEMH
jgi:NAD(P)-dependent dehydrogenase (short-subunit alcohol dehydrogenase family)